MACEQHIFTSCDGHVAVSGVYVGLPFGRAKQVLLGRGFTIDDGNSSPTVLHGDIGALGTCSLKIWESNNKVVRIAVSTQRQVTEQEALAAIGQVAADLKAGPQFDYNGYGVAPKPHEINHFWDLSGGLIKVVWDGFNVHGFSSRNGDGLDHLSFSLQGPVVKDEAYWRSEVD